ncbi:winged helix-turn-helix domain-containing protein [Luteimonas sp. TWI1416]|uniref:protein kinase domain-containing protein n=1 Tax=unclassified Luteimonas TaxID=2629088 RepID=UPI003209A85C
MTTIDQTDEPLANDDEGLDFRYRFGTATFDESTFELCVDDAPVAVERRALEVLAYLLRHAGEVVTKEELFKEVWAGRITVDKVLPNAITKLRKALGPANAGVLTTQPRLGYRLTGLTERVVVRARAPAHLALRESDPVPLRPRFVLRRLLGSSSHSEVWLGEHARTGEHRVYKYASSGGRLRSLKREATLARLLARGHQGPSEAPFARLIDWHFEAPPFFLEYAYCGTNLSEWSTTHLAELPTPARLALFLQIADAVAAAHQIGVLHKDIKPANVLVAAAGDGWRVCLTDFGSGSLLEPGRLDAMGITRHDLTATGLLKNGPDSGTPLYLAPEVVAGQPQTVRSDVYALGLILYQLLQGDLSRPMASGWEHDIDDALLREDITLATHGNPERRLASAPELARRLRRLGQRREEAERARQDREHALQTAAVLARTRAQRPYLIAAFVLLVTGLSASLWFHREARHAQQIAETELARANALNTFVTEDVIGRANPLITANGHNANIRDVLLAARDRVDPRFGARPLIAATVHASLATLFNSVELLPEARQEFARALELFEAQTGADSLETFKARSTLIRVMTRTSEFEAARRALDLLEQQYAAAPDPERAYQLALARSTYFTNAGEFTRAVPEYETALRLLAQLHADDLPMHDSLRLDLVQVYTQVGRAEDGRQLAQTMLEDLQARDAPNALAIAVTRQVMAGAEIKLGRYEEAERMLLDAQQTVVAMTGAGSMRNMMLVNSLLEIDQHRQRWPQALAHARTLYEGIRAKLGEDSIFAATTLGVWGQVLFLAGQPDEAAPKLEAAYRQLVQLQSSANPQTQLVGFWYAATTGALGHWEQNEATLATLDAAQLNAAAASPAWPLRLDALRGVLRHQHHHDAQARPALEATLASLRQQPDVEPALVALVETALHAR